MKFHFSKNQNERKSIRITVRFFVYSSMLFLITILGSTGLYLYRYVYKAFLFSEENIQLKTVVAPETFSIQNFEQILEHIKNKQDQNGRADWSKAQNIFLKVRSSPASESVPDPEPADTEPKTIEGPNLQ